MDALIWLTLALSALVALDIAAVRYGHDSRRGGNRGDW